MKNLTTKRIFISIILAFAINSANAQNADSTSNTNSAVPAAAPSDTGITDMGVAVAPSNLRFRTKPGTTETKHITITNDTRKLEKFKISVANYDMSEKGAVKQFPIGTDFEYGLAKNISITPSFVELKPGEAIKVAITVTIPDAPESYRASWALVMIDQTTEKKYITPSSNEKDNIVMGVIPVFGFGVYIFQNPPNVSLNKVEITKFNFSYDNSNRYIYVNAKNVGTGLGFCKLYVEINNLNTGAKEKMFVKQFTIFPGKERVLDYQLPGNIAKGSYVATAVLDFGSSEEIEAAEIEFKVE